MLGCGLAGVRLWRDRLDAHQSHQRWAAFRLTCLPSARKAWLTLRLPRNGSLQMDFVDSFHQGQLVWVLGHRLVVRARSD